MTVENQKLVEPFGHFSPLSKLERIWSARVPGKAICRKRVQSFDPLSGASFSPMEYSFEDIDHLHVKEAPTKSWIDDAFLAFVKGEFSSGEERRPAPGLPEIIAERYIERDIFAHYMLSCEREMLYPYHEATDRHTDQDLFENFKRLLTDDGLGNKKNAGFAPFEELSRRIEEWAEGENRLLCVLPSFPFKDQSRLRVGPATADAFDLGEIALLIRLHLLSLAFYQFHPWGVDWLIAADGNFYADMFGIPREQAESYFEKIRLERTAMNLSGTLSILDLEEIMLHYRQGCSTAFDRDKDLILNRIQEISVSDDENLSKAFAVLKRGMRQNQSTREFETYVTADELWKICNWESLQGDESENVKGLHRDLEVKATEIAIHYAAENIVLKRHDVLNRVFPDSMRTTIHAKEGQVAVPQLGSCFPWNGVAYIPDPNNFSAKSLQVKRFHDLTRKSPQLVAYKDRISGSTLFYSDP
ncbi:L-tyrosine/L-tryptophan isonitrile synthase family protein [Sulfitobacter sp. R86518]|uniref:L-tyrosine/L-tryptophan isonitrile synthase family protein n=1 Tax=Sulfitobacter sp. R86518 TaxID=3093858 RepID=UPI0036DB44A8